MNGEISFLYVIGERKQKENLISALAANGATVFSVIYGRGFVKSNEILKAFGLVSEEDKVVITCLIKKIDCDKAFAVLNEDFKFDRPNTGIAFTVPVENLKY
ncbi:MAG: hypothetical protein LBT30_06050 [Clostridiales bacterium]|jgi:hypothetical protein|nr:hypothetical protein [Clostridiales bacterium]